MRLHQHPAIGHGEVAHTVRAQYAMYLCEMRALLPLFTDVFDDMVSQHDIEGPIGEWQSRALHALETIAILDQSVIDHIDRVDLTAELCMPTEVIRDATRPCTHLKHSNGLWTRLEAEKPLNL